MHVLPALDIAKLPDDVDALKGLIAELHAQYSTMLESLHQQILTLQRLQFGHKSERLAGQAELFAEPIALPVPPLERERVSYERNRPGRPRLPKDLPRQRIDYELDEAEKASFDSVRRIGEEISETLDYTPAKLVVIEHARAKYVCERDGESTIRIAHAEPSPLPKSNASAGLLAQVVVAKYADHIPLHRQEAIFGRHGVAIPRQTLCEWALGAAELLAVLMPGLRAHVLAAPRVHCDDTVLPMQEAGRAKTRTARLWGYLGAGQRRDDERGLWVEHPPAVVFEFTQSRESTWPLLCLSEYRGYLQADAYSGFDALYRGGQIIEVGCFAHARRKFFEVAQAHKPPGLAHEALAFIARLYELEARIKDATPEEKRAVRQAESLPILGDFRAWLESHYRTLLPKSPLAQAFHYALANWQALIRYTENGVLMPDNNALERALRPVAVGRKNYLFAGSPRGGEAAAIAYSLIGTAKLSAVEPFAYLKDVLARLPSHPVNRLAELLPFNWTPASA
jgi:transposase